MGPSNYLGRAYQQTPIAITVEGANILTRSMIIFGQGAIRGHPYVLQEIAAVRRARPEHRASRIRRRFFRPRRFRRVEQGARAVDGAHARALRRAPGDGEYPRLLPAAHAALQRVRFRGRRRDVRARRLAQAPRAPVGAARRHPEPALSRVVRAQALRGRRPSGRGPAVPALVGAGRARAHRGRVLRALRQSAGPPAAVRAAVRRVSLGREFRPPRDRLGEAVCNSVLRPGPARERLTAGMFVPRTEAHPSGRSRRRSSRRSPPSRSNTSCGRRHANAAFAGRPDAPRSGGGGRRGVITQADAEAIERAQRCGARRSWWTIFRRTSAGPRSIRPPQPVTADELRAALGDVVSGSRTRGECSSRWRRRLACRSRSCHHGRSGGHARWPVPRAREAHARPCRLSVFRRRPAARGATTRGREMDANMSRAGRRRSKRDGLKAGDRVAIMLRNSPEWVMCDIAALGLGLIVVPLYTQDRPDNVAYILNDSQLQGAAVRRRRAVGGLESVARPARRTSYEC